MNSSVTNLTSLVKRALDECKTVAEKKYVAKALSGLYRHREAAIMKLLEENTASSQR